MYADKFESWRDRTSGMHQLLVWTALEVEGLDANSQPYNSAVNGRINKKFNLDAGWILDCANGDRETGGEKAKDKKPSTERYKILA